ncbi:MAG: hypothetical protein KAU14_05805, partial [Thermoplasmata archaeon]|nr:hypothetical protein [Thermoplasmata archaeon]
MSRIRPDSKVSSRKGLSTIVLATFLLTVAFVNVVSMDASGEPPTGVRGVEAYPEIFSPNDDGFRDSTNVTVVADSKQKLYLNIHNETGVMVRSDVPLKENESGIYLGEWDAKDSRQEFVPDGKYEIRAATSKDPEDENKTITAWVRVDTGKPRLRNGGASPKEGHEGNAFTFSVTYADSSGVPIRYFSPADFHLPRDQVHPRKAIDSRGYVYVVYMSDLKTEDHWEIWCTLISPTGAVLGTIQVSDDDDFNSVYPSIALDSDQKAHVVWADERKDGVWEIYYSKIERLGGSLNDLTSPDYLVSYADNKDSGRVVPGPFYGVEILDRGTNTKYLEHPDIDVDVYDNVHVVWSDRRDAPANLWQVYYQMQDNDATPAVLIDDTRISTPPGPAISMCPVIAAGQPVETFKSCNIHIAWQDTRDYCNYSTYEIYYEKANPCAVPHTGASVP